MKVAGFVQRFFCQTILLCTLCGTSLGQKKAVTIDFEIHNFRRLTDLPAAYDVAVVNLQSLDNQKAFFESITSVRLLHLTAKSPVRLDAAIIPLLERLESLSLDNIILSEGITQAILTAQLANLELVRAEFLGNPTPQSITSINRLSFLACKGALDITFPQGSNAEHLSLSWPTEVSLQMDTRSFNGEIRLISNRWHLNDTFAYDVRCETLKLNGFVLYTLDASRFRASKLVVETSLLDHEFSIVNLAESAVTQIHFSGCVQKELTGKTAEEKTDK